MCYCRRRFFKTFEFIRGEEGSQAVLQSHHGPPKPGGDAGDDKPAERDEAESLTAALRPLSPVYGGDDRTDENESLDWSEATCSKLTSFRFKT